MTAEFLQLKETENNTKGTPGFLFFATSAVSSYFCKKNKLEDHVLGDV